MGRYTISRFDAVAIPNADPEAKIVYKKRFVLYDHFGERIVSQPFDDRSPEHDSMIKLVEDMNQYADAEFKAYNIELMGYLDVITFEPKSTYKSKKRINWKEIS